MRKITYGMIVSMDGYIEDRAGGLNWSTPDEEIHRHFNNLELETVVHFCGRKLYEIMDFWRTAEQTQSLRDYEIEFARAYNSKPNFVFSRTLQKAQPGDIIMREIDREFVNKQKRQPGTYISVGGADLARSFMAFNLIDEVRLYITPIILGGGKPMFYPQNQSTNMKLVDTKTFASGLVLLTYRKCGNDGSRDECT